MVVMPRWPALAFIASTLLAACPSVNPQTSSLIEYERSGGIAGRTVRLVVQDNGEARFSARGDSANLAVGPDELARLKDLLQQIRFDTLRAEYRPSHAGADRFEYMIVHRGRRIVLQDGAVPPDLQPLIDLLNGLVRSRR